jgi:beta-lactam-binding protein with PASTA domain
VTRSHQREQAGRCPRLRASAIALGAAFALLLVLATAGCGKSAVPAGGSNPTTPSIAVPDVVGSPQGNAAQTLAAAGLRIGIVSTEQTSVAFPGDVATQKPAAGTRVPAGTAVALVIAQAPATGAPVRVPQLVGLDYKVAAPKLAGLGLSYMALYDSASVRPQGTIVAQVPKAGVTVPKGTVVQVTISLAKVPNPSAPTTP